MNKLWLIGATLAFQAWFAHSQAPSAPGSAGRIDDPLVITQIRVLSGHPESGQVRQQLTTGREPASITATFAGKGSGFISGHWALATPSDGALSALDLTATPLLSPADQFAQRKFRQLGTFSFSLSPGERHIIPAPPINAALLTELGRYHVLLRLDSVSSISSGATVMPKRIAPVVLEITRAQINK